MIRHCARLAASGLLLLGACSPYSESALAGDASRAAAPRFAGDPGDPASALLEHALAAYFAKVGADHPTICAKIPEAEKGPRREAAFMKRFTALAPLDRCVWSEGRYRDSITGGDAMVFDVHGLECADIRHCQGLAGFTAANLGAEYQQYDLIYADGVWHIEPGTLRIVS